MFLEKEQKSSKDLFTVYATQDGEAMSIEKMPDPIFADRILGDGICVHPTSRKVYSPVNGKVDSIAATSHAFGLVGESGAEIMIHIGVDTVELEGKGFKAKVKEGQVVSIGDLLCEVDLPAIQAAGLSLYTAILLTNGDAFSIVETFHGKVCGGNDKVFRYQKKT